ncbi:hypothetical protein [Sphingosinithalassobacter portus]|uniref:hypothetical protein n=1 Tax=Stakelama portus TaxID=2676234 RepID=UPI000D6E65B6|nr:hypothetical protein [Sphingosinithalassobacter portus]
MSLSPLRGLVFFLIGLPVGFILSALAFVVMGRDTVAPDLAPYAVAIAAFGGIVAAIWNPKK